MFRMDPFLALYFCLFINDLPVSLPSSVSCSLYADDLAIWSSSPSVPTAVEATQGALFRLERLSEDWCLPFNLCKCEASFLEDAHQANLLSNLLLLDCRLRFNPTSTFLGVTFDRTLSFSRHVSSLKAKFFFVSRPYAVSLLPHGAPLRSSSLFCINLFFGPFSLTLHPDGFLSQALPISPNWNAFTERVVAPSPAASRRPLSLYYSPRLLYLPYESL